MKAIIALAAILCGSIAHADCVVVDHGGYLAYERGCPAIAGKAGGASGYIDTDNDGIGDTYRPDARDR